MIQIFQFDKAYWLTFAVVLAATAYSSVGYYHTDEHFQILEFAYWKLGQVDQDLLPWEFSARIRSSIQPSIVVVLYRLWTSAWSQVDSFQFTFFLRLLSATLSFISIGFLTHTTQKWVLPLYRKKYLFLIGFFWFFPFIYVRFSSESWSFGMFGLALALLIHPRLFSWKYFLIGILLGLAFLFRYQVGLMIAGLLLWCVVFKIREKNGLKHCFQISFGLMLVLSLGIYLDTQFYGDFNLTPLNYFRVNLLEGKASNFGVASGWFYFIQGFLYLIPPFSLIAILLILLYGCLFPKSLITWTVTPFILVHFLIPHKEVRFLIPAMIYFPLMVICSWQKLEEKLAWVNKKRGIFWRLLVILNLFPLVVIIFRPAADSISLNREINRFSGQTVLFSTVGHPLVSRGLTHSFYRKNDLEVVLLDKDQPHWFPRLKQLAESKRFKNRLLMTAQAIEEQSSEELKLVYQTPALFLQKINFFDWIGKSKLKKRYLYQFR